MTTSKTLERIESLEALHKPVQEFTSLPNSKIKNEQSAKLFINNAVTRHGLKSATQADKALTCVNTLRSGMLNKIGMQQTEDNLKDILSESDTTITTLYDFRKDVLSINVEYVRDGKEMSVNGFEYLSSMVMASED